LGTLLKGCKRDSAPRPLLAIERTDEAAAHADAMKAAGETGGKYHEIIGHWQIT
jgi:hypothetical protein